MIVFLVLSVIHVLAFAWIWFHWVRIPEISIEQGGFDQRFSVIIPVRNEEGNIGNLLFQIDTQNYPKDQFEVIVVDDHSEDGTAEVVKRLIPEVGYQLKYFEAVENKGKKAAITLGVAKASFEYIVTTDGDCRVSPDWLGSYASGYQKTGCSMLTGSVKMTGSGWLAAFQQVEFGCLIGMGAGALHSGNPSMCNGANLSYKKVAFENVQGYQGNDQIPSGDDEFLLQKVYGQFPGKISFLRSPENIVFTPSKLTIGELINQRVRWSGKWKYHKSWFVKWTAIYVFFDFLFLLTALLLAGSGFFDWRWVGLIAGIRWLIDLGYILSVGRFFSISAMKSTGVSLGLQIIYPVFVSFLGIASIFGKYSWKGRRY
ncbi:glycosyltransferase [Marinoscillum sp. MHG1-6]|uniref:glycosyltransferase n=1 Tax=Marinoscillum sp. MHG1-6 TaxID=2959627 RepID=UPI00215727E0|nr:glycosyltransferase [Marinoscillum sp. MHG1-6]